MFRYSVVNAANLTPLHRQGPPLTPLAFRLNADNAVIPEKNMPLQKIFLFHVMKNYKLIANQKFFDQRLRSFPSIFLKVW